jgi:hypothetical protein
VADFTLDKHMRAIRSEKSLMRISAHSDTPFG